MRRLIVLVLVLVAVGLVIYFLLPGETQPIEQPPAGGPAVDVDNGPVLNPPANAGDGDSDRDGR